MPTKPGFSKNLKQVRQKFAALEAKKTQRPILADLATKFRNSPLGYPDKAETLFDCG